MTLWANLGALHADRAQQLDLALCKLITKGAELGELERRQVIGADGALREIRVPPAIWFERLELAITRGAFDRLTIDAIVERILLPV